MLNTCVDPENGFFRFGPLLFGSLNAISLWLYVGPLTELT